MSEIRENLIRLRYARQKIEHIEEELQKSSVVASGELRHQINGIIAVLDVVKTILLREE